MDNTYIKGTVIMHQPIRSFNILLSFIPPHPRWLGNLDAFDIWLSG